MLEINGSHVAPGDTCFLLGSTQRHASHLSGHLLAPEQLQPLGVRRNGAFDIVRAETDIQEGLNAGHEHYFLQLVVVRPSTTGAVSIAASMILRVKLKQPFGGAAPAPSHFSRVWPRSPVRPRSHRGPESARVPGCYV